MINPKQLPAMLQLLDDEDLVTQQAISEALLEYGDTLQIELARLQKAPSDSQRSQLQVCMRPYSIQQLQTHWGDWRQATTEAGRLENGLALLSEYLSGFEIPEGLHTLLDRIANAYSVHSTSTDPMDLARYLFTHLEFKGEDQNFYHPRNSDLCRVIKSRRGNPITLACLFILVSRRLDMSVGGCNFPGHFLARVEHQGQIHLVDCFNGGKEIDHKVIAAMSEQSPWSAQHALQSPANTESILTRVLSNLLRSFQEQDSPLQVQLMTRLLQTMETRDPELPAANPDTAGRTLPPAAPKFKIGQLVRHQRYGYRGVIIDFDMACKADEDWFRKNQTQPNRDQAWYHVLVDQTDQATYAAQSNLLADDSAREIFHPLVPYFFTRFENGRYIRNHKPWHGL